LKVCGRFKEPKLFERPDVEARKALWKVVDGSAWKYVASFLLAGVGVGALLQTAEFVRRSHPLLAEILFGNPGIVFTVFGSLLALAAVVSGGICVLSTVYRSIVKRRN
jgi:hypothetical protein